ncbi:hypothetical protein Nepgr_018277 [Nepenthes gracilis]|uniref:Uncharacterized protein n=1 Tax=Nepenthes gracilis TaxID=150966 RepID=A0AAD3STE0_NEPGR|nr:hypothetical protein Nepgr_018277 [Nepenthes gracilis]
MNFESSRGDTSTLRSRVSYSEGLYFVPIISPSSASDLFLISTRSGVAWRWKETCLPGVSKALFFWGRI